jgi:hypothetical protein
MKKAILVAGLFLTLASAVQAQTQITPRSNVQIAGAETPTPAPGLEVQAAVVTPTPVTTIVTPTPVVVGTAGATTKGGLPISGTLETTILFALIGIALMSIGAYKAIKA